MTQMQVRDNEWDTKCEYGGCGIRGMKLWNVGCVLFGRFFSACCLRWTCPMRLVGSLPGAGLQVPPYSTGYERARMQGHGVHLESESGYNVSKHLVGKKVYRPVHCCIWSITRSWTENQIRPDSQAVQCVPCPRGELIMCGSVTLADEQASRLRIRPPSGVRLAAMILSIDMKRGCADSVHPLRYRS